MIEFARISKSFPGVAALQDVSFQVERATCHALLGENGAGKSTLGKLLAGIQAPDRGEVRIDGQPVHFASPRDAARAGVAIVHQELLFCPNLSIAENLCLHDLPRHGRWLPRLDRCELRRRAEALLAAIGLELDVDLPIRNLSIGQEQMVQIAAAVGHSAKIIVFDEPTSSLGRAETERLFSLIRRLKADGVTMIYVSHRLEEIFALCDAVTVLRDGRHVSTRPIAAVTRDDMVRQMVGRNVEAEPLPHAERTKTAERLAIRGLSSAGRFHDISLSVHAGEIVGLAGLVGAGRTELVESIFGLVPADGGTLHIDGSPSVVRSPLDAVRQGIGLIPEDRKQHGLVLEMNVRENLTLATVDQFRGPAAILQRGRERQLASDFCARLAVRTESIDAPIRSLSGGNQQKIVMAKWLAARCRILLIDEPTRGVDVGGKREIHHFIIEQARQGAAILLISSDLPELLALSNRIFVLRAGRLVGELSREEAEPERVVRLMAGIEP